MWGMGVFLWAQPRPHCKGDRAQALPNFGGSLLFMRTPSDAELPGSTYGRGLSLGVSHSPTSQHVDVTSRH